MRRGPYWGPQDQKGCSKKIMLKCNLYSWCPSNQACLSGFLTGFQVLTCMHVLNKYHMESISRSVSPNETKFLDIALIFVTTLSTSRQWTLYTIFAFFFSVRVNHGGGIGTTNYFFYFGLQLANINHY